MEIVIFQKEVLDMKLNYGSVTNPNTNVTENVEFNILDAVNVKSLAIGLGLTAAGIAIIVAGHIRSGADAAMTADLSALARADLTDVPEKVIGKFLF
jgi:hypothetical protein